MNEWVRFGIFLLIVGLILRSVSRRLQEAANARHAIWARRIALEEAMLRTLKAQSKK